MPAAKWLESNDLAVLNENNELVLTDNAIETVTSVGCPVLVVDPPARDDQSLWSLRKQLVSKQWALTTDTPAAEPSVHDKVANGKSACKMYFTILLDCCLALVYADYDFYGLAILSACVLLLVP